ncbi:thiol:disulfide interchange protein DsbA/DsbL [Reinekea marina]|uniref:Thiol:disulfide interchange protein n=1 Tax=Reinekea marina TaxID=1310421 RepID=A0ABV7WRF6_9GAMM|nr:thiol:disulfide interchange protein DsbA/DsbL [Reinekea marina]MDN3647684.1 thiol:disulfide interchange protein DsbA/DsbL [Reinekea marina]
MIKKLMITAALFAVSLFAAAEDKWVEGVHYRTLANPLPTTYSGDEIGEITEFFSYGCIHCFNLEPAAQAFKKSLPENIRFSPVPVMFNERQSAEVKAYYASVLLKINDDAHQAIYNEFHVARKPMRSDKAFAKFFTRFGVSEDQYMAMANSFGVAGKVNQSIQLTGKSGIQGTPSIMANGKYLIDSGAVGGNNVALEVAKWLVERDAAQ